MEALSEAIKRIFEEAANRGGVVWIPEEAKRLAAEYRGYGVSAEEIADALTMEGMRRSDVALRLGGTGLGGKEPPPATLKSAIVHRPRG